MCVEDGISGTPSHGSLILAVKVCLHFCFHSLMISIALSL
jgi:hypothetical protein